MQKVTVNKEKCIGCGTCAALCPEIFELDAEFKAIAKAEETDVPCAKDAKDSCPVQAIEIG